MKPKRKQSPETVEHNSWAPVEAHHGSAYHPSPAMQLQDNLSAQFGVHVMPEFRWSRRTRMALLLIGAVACWALVIAAVLGIASLFS